MADTVNEPSSRVDTLPEDKDLYPRLMAGDPEAWELIDTFYRPILNAYFSTRDVRTDEDRQDAIQETFKIFFKTLISGRYSPTQGNLSQWIYGIAGRLLTKHKKTYASEYSKQNELSEEQSDVNESPEESSVDQITQRVQSALAHLPENDRNIIRIKINADDRTWADIAQELGISESTAKMRYFRAIAKLEHLLS